MKHSELHSFWRLLCLLLLFPAFQPVTHSYAQTPMPPSPVSSAASAPAQGGDTLTFAFDRAPWREVIKWIADECELALQFEDMPPGSFSYTDPKLFSATEAIDRLNLFLLPQGYTLVRSGGLLSVINLGDSRSLQQLDALAKLVTPDELEQLNDQEVVKCIFALGELKADDAVQELSALNLMTTPAVFDKTNRIMITDTSRKLRNVKVILDAFQPRTLRNGTVMKNFPLQHVSAEDILMVARPHLGLATGEMIGIDVSLSADLQGENIFVTGVDDKIKLIESLIESLDKPQQSMSTADGEPELRSHFVEGGNLETVYNVLQTLLAGKSLRLSMDEAADSIIALATPDIQSEIARTVTELQASEEAFEVIPLKTADPYFVISLLEQMLDLPDALDDPDEIDPDAPKIDADPGSRRLFVRAKPVQIEQIKKIVAGLDVGSASQGEQLRVLPLTGQQAQELIEIAAKFWHGESPIILLPSGDGRSEATERAVNRPGKSRLTSLHSSNRDQEIGRILSENIRSQAPPIRCQVTPRGLLLQSEDISALDRFEEQLRTIAGRSESVPSPPIVFYLRYVRPDDALRMLAELLDGGESASEAVAGSLVNGLVSSPGSFLGSIVTSRDGTTTMMSGTITVVSDPRLNRLIAQGTPGDIERIENYLEIIDKDKGITAVETYGESHVIELSYASASEVAAAIRDAYAGRVTAASSAAGGGGGGGPNDPARGRDNEQRERNGGDENGKNEGRNTGNNPRGATSSPRADLEPKMTIAIHEPSNSLIVTAPDQLFEQVRKLAELIDQRSEKSVAILSSANTALLQSVLSPVSGQRTGTSSGRSNSDRRSSSDSRQAFSEALRNRFGR